MINERRTTEGPPYGILLAAVVVVVIGIPKFMGGGGGAVTEFIAKLPSPFGRLLIPIILLLVILYLLRPFVSGIVSAGDPNSIHRASGSPVGVALVLVLVIFLLYSKFSIFGDDDDDDSEEWL